MGCVCVCVCVCNRETSSSLGLLFFLFAASDVSCAWNNQTLCEQGSWRRWRKQPGVSWAKAISELWAAQARPGRAPPALEPCSGWKVPLYFSKPLPQSACEMIGVNSVQSASKVRVRTSGSVKYSREDSIRRQSHRSKSMKISNSSEFSAKETKVKRHHVRAYWQLYVRIMKFGTVFASV